MTESLEQVRAAIHGLLPRLRRFARTMAHTDDDADDLVAAATTRALEDEARAWTDHESWLFALVREAGRQSPSAHYPFGGEHDERVVTALRALPEEERTAIALVLIEGLSYAQAAQVMALPIDLLTTRLARGREVLQAVL